MSGISGIAGVADGGRRPIDLDERINVGAGRVEAPREVAPAADPQLKGAGDAATLGRSGARRRRARPADVNPKGLNDGSPGGDREIVTAAVTPGVGDKPDDMDHPLFPEHGPGHDRPWGDGEGNAGGGQLPSHGSPIPGDPYEPSPRYDDGAEIHVPGTEDRIPNFGRDPTIREPSKDLGSKPLDPDGTPIGLKPELPPKPRDDEPGGDDNGPPTRDPTTDPDYSEKITDKDTPSQPKTPDNQDDGESSAESREDRERETRDPTDDPGYSDNISDKDTPSW